MANKFFSEIIAVCIFPAILYYHSKRTVRIADVIHFIRQILFPKWKPKEKNEENDGKPNRFFVWLHFVAEKLRSKESVGIIISVLIHIILLLLFSLLMFPKITKWHGIDLLGGWNPPDVKSVDIAIQPGNIEPEKQEVKPEEADAAPGPKNEEKAEITKPEPSTTENPNRATAENMMPSDLPSPDSSGGTPKNRKGNLVSGGGYGGRTPHGRGQSVGTGDCSARGENAVEAALQWLAAHQQKDGGWNFDFDETCKECTQSGKHGSRVAATALALLPFLGAGYTHQIDGPYKKTVENGLFYLISKGVEEQRGFGLNMGTQGMYSHGIATIALCEAYSMSHPKQQKLAHAAQESLRFIENAQDRNGGGWRYTPNQAPGDLSVSAWQIMALKSGKLAELHVSQPTIYLANDFIESVALDGGRQFNYLPSHERVGTGPDSPKTCTATGLLLRMYLGWEPGDEKFDDGIKSVAEWGPLLKKDGSECNLYYTYYGTLALHHYGGSHWNAWNTGIQEFLIQMQSNRGHESGSWFFSDHYCNTGGRLFNTVLAALILETPYRIMPLFRRR